MVTSPYILDVTLESFENEVIARSQTTPVLVDFWAAWCGPCQALMPILAKLAEEYQGRFFLAKVNSDEQQALASRFKVRSLPTVKLFKKGTEVAEFLGAQPERTVRALLDQHIGRPSDALLDAALDEEGAGHIDRALAQLREAHDRDPANNRLTIHLGRILLEQGHTEEAERILNGITGRVQGDQELAPLLARLEFVRLAASAPPLPALQQALANEPGNLEARVRLGVRYLLKGDYEPALEQWLAVVRADRRFDNDAGRRMLLSAFAVLGPKNELVRKYRNLLAMALN